MVKAITRRTALAATAAGLLFKPTFAAAEEIEIAPGLFDIGLTNLPLTMAQQHCEQWCWAASIETIFATWGYSAPQEAMVEYYLGRNGDGSLVCAPASDQLMLNAISSTFQEPGGRQFRGSYFVAKDDSTNIYNYAWWGIMQVELSHGRPMLAAYRTGPQTGHAVVVTHIRVQRYNDPSRPSDLIGMTVRDPWPDNPNRRQLTLQEVLNLRFIAAVNVKTVEA